MPAIQLNPEECYLLDRAQAQGYVTVDRREEYDVVAEAYREGGRVEKQPYLEVALGNETSRVIYSLIEADKRFSEATETLLRFQLAHYYLMTGRLSLRMIIALLRAC